MKGTNVISKIKLKKKKKVFEVINNDIRCQYPKQIANNYFLPEVGSC